MNATRMTTPALAAALLLGGAGALAAQEAGPGWLAWTGCWEAVTAPGTGAAAPVVCVVPEAGGAAEFLTLRDGAVGDRRRVAADGERHAVDRGGCRGWESARWASDGYRLFVRSELDCAGVRRATSTILAFLPGGGWVDARALESGGETYVSAQRYRPLNGRAEQIAGLAATMRERGAAVASACEVAGARLSVRDVTEASGQAHPGAVQALLAERGTGFTLDAGTLVALSEAGVPGETTDLMVALSFPDRFEVDRGSRRTAERTPARGDDAAAWAEDPWADPLRDPVRGGGWGYGGWSPSGYCYGGCYRYGYGNGYGGRYGSPYDRYGNDPYYGGYGPIVVVRRREDPDNGGRVVKGRGFTRGGAAPEHGTAAPRTRDRTQSTVTQGGDRSGSGSSSGGQSGSGGEEKTERRAKRRGGGS